MKKYIFVTYNVCNMGGGQLYVLRRCKHLLAKGYDILVIIAYDSGYFPLEDQFSGVSILHIPEIETLSINTGRKRKKEILNQISRFTAGCKDIYIESHTLPAIEWGELIAAELNARHLAYPLAEPLYSKVRFSPAKEIIKRKLYAGEFYGCTSVSLRKIFNRDLPFNNYVNIGFETDELVEKCIPQIDIFKKKDNFVITTIGRLSKEYFEPFIVAVVDFAIVHPEQSIVLILAGGSPDKTRVQYLHTKYNNDSVGLKNLNIVYTGYIEKLGKDIFKQTDVFVGMGTAVINSISQGCATIIIDAHDRMQYSSGLFGIDTFNFAYSENGKLWPIKDKIEEVYRATDEEKRKFSQCGKQLFDESYNNKVCMEKLDNIIQALPIVEKKNIPQNSWFYITYVNVGVYLAMLYFRLFKKR